MNILDLPIELIEKILINLSLKNLSKIICKKLWKIKLYIKKKEINKIKEKNVKNEKKLTNNQIK